jgi:hypothetical protein
MLFQYSVIEDAVTVGFDTFLNVRVRKPVELCGFMATGEMKWVTWEDGEERAPRLLL